jgi:sulfate permease, SulP family
MQGVREAVAAVVCGTVVLLVNVALGSLLFTGDMADFAAVGVSMALLSTVVIAVVVGLRSSIPVTIAGLQDGSTVVLALAIGGVSRALGPDIAPADRLASAVAVVIAATFVTGLTSFAVGYLRLGRLLRYMPYPVIGGFLAGTGWLLLTGGVGMVSDGTSPFLSGAGLLRWGPPMVVAAGLLWAMGRWSSPLLLPGTILGVCYVFYAGWLVTGGTADSAMDAGWLLGPFSGDGGLQLPGPWTALGADWGAVLGQAGVLGSLLLVVLVSVVLSAGGLELALDTEVDADRELRATGLANMASALVGGGAGYVYLSVTVLGRTAGGRTRRLPLLVAALAGGFLLLGTQPLAWIPRPALAVVLMLLGFSFLHDWVLQTRSRMPVLEHLVIVAILGVIAVFGFLVGVAVGIALAIVLFAVAASRVDVVRDELTARTQRSLVDRPPSEVRALDAEGDRVLVLLLQGFLFFGTAHAVAERVEARADHELSAVVLDLRRVTGFDSSATFALRKLHRRLQRSGAALVISQASPEALRVLAGEGLSAAEDVVLAEDLDHALEWCEERLLAAAAPGTSDPDLLAAVQLLVPDPGEAAAIAPLLERRTMDAGEAVLRQGEPVPGLHLLLAGQLRVERAGPGGPHRLRLLRPGAVFGEMSLYRDAPASASVVARGDVEVALLRSDVLEALEGERPAVAGILHRALIGVLADRVSEWHRAADVLRR